MKIAIVDVVVAVISDDRNAYWVTAQLFTQETWILNFWSSDVMWCVRLRWRWRCRDAEMPRPQCDPTAFRWNHLNCFVHYLYLIRCAAWASHIFWSQKLKNKIMWRKMKSKSKRNAAQPVSHWWNGNWRLPSSSKTKMGICICDVRMMLNSSNALPVSFHHTIDRIVASSSRTYCMFIWIGVLKWKCHAIGHDACMRALSVTVKLSKQRIFFETKRKQFYSSRSSCFSSLFTALRFSLADGCSSLANRNLPASFWNSNYVPPVPAPTHHQVSSILSFAHQWCDDANSDLNLLWFQVPDLYSADGSYSTDPWVPHAAHYGSYAHAAHAHVAQAHAYHHNMAQYGSLLRLPQHYGHSSRYVTLTMPLMRRIFINIRHNHNQCHHVHMEIIHFLLSFFYFVTDRLHHDQQTAHALESAAAYSSYPTMAGKYWHLQSLYHTYASSSIAAFDTQSNSAHKKIWITKR